MHLAVQTTGVKCAPHTPALLSRCAASNRAKVRVQLTLHCHVLSAAQCVNAVLPGCSPHPTRTDVKNLVTTRPGSWGAQRSPALYALPASVHSAAAHLRHPAHSPPGSALAAQPPAAQRCQALRQPAQSPYSTRPSQADWPRRKRQLGLIRSAAAATRHPRCCSTNSRCRAVAGEQSRVGRAGASLEGLSILLTTIP